MPPLRHWWVLASLGAGIALGAWIEYAGGATAHGVSSSLEAIGTLWLNALRMTIGPLVFAMLVSAVASVADAMATGRLASRAIGWFAGLLLLAGVLAVALSQALVAAAADNAIMALVVFATLFGFAATKLPQPQRLVLTNFFTAMAEAMVVIVHWVLLLAPIGVFALALGVGRQAGVGAAGLLLQYAVTVALVIALAIIAIYIVVGLRSRVSVREFAVALAPVQVVAASTQSSLATLPAMIECARLRLHVTPRVAHLVLPLAVAVFRYTSPLGNLAVCFFIAAMYGVEPSLLQVAGAILVAIAVSIGSVGLPGQVSFIASVALICAALGLPVEALGILVAVEIIPDIFRTIGNVTADVAVTTLVDEVELPADR